MKEIKTRKQKEYGKKNKLVFGVGLNDLDEPISENGKMLPFYECWMHMIQRCYYPKNINYSNYGGRGVVVADEWLVLSNFKRWYDENYINGWQLDKDLFSNGQSKIYSSSTCCFLPREINKFMTNKQKNCGDLPTGVSYKKGCNQKPYRVQMNKYGKHETFGYYSTPQEAYKVYCLERNKYARELARKYRNSFKNIKCYIDLFIWDEKYR